ncbi:hypothetical protein HanRHA438_Chr00c36g0856151 [Helianthus annuus]|uniref:Uncharacterized protein n=1 Tax=Helianthus annuus TaxID=4232 RepID=A0A9K3MZQ4_HELAN|nr:hypothetical protein HanXRQr2_Chr11g0487071 [Helianthus annuus]KAJ0874854.1 hypothetical protein HanPSC8_Chr11g0469261 [Helianthus annuus]KAJ0953940.1 hypothetical protein HanRHA438_Chr00c36g0856151 [Helianthus annuus]
MLCNQRAGTALEMGEDVTTRVSKIPYSHLLHVNCLIVYLHDLLLCNCIRWII